MKDQRANEAQKGTGELGISISIGLVKIPVLAEITCRKSQDGKTIEVIELSCQKLRSVH
jgi:hypothetical protein